MDCFTKNAKQAIDIIPVITEDFVSWRNKQSTKVKNWMQANDFKAESCSVCLLADRNGKLEKVFLGLANADDFWAFGVLPNKLFTGVYKIQTKQPQTRAAIAWGLGGYKFTAFKESPTSKAQLLIPEDCDLQYIENIVSSISLVRDLINYPAENMGPAALAKAATSFAIEANAKIEQVIGDDLLKKGYAAIHAVGRSSSNAPRLIDITWGKKKKAPLIVLVGKGVCFDSGGLNIKPDESMNEMKEDMAGAAHAIGLARMIINAKLPLRLRILIPAVENMVSGNSYKPADVITTYKGTTVEVGNTDAEGRLILADTLALACEAKPDLIIDFATLTGAACVALGTEIAAMFTNCDAIAKQLVDIAAQEDDPITQLPLYRPYRKLIDSEIADLRSCATIRYGGAIIAALFLQEFVDKDIPWVHFDIPGSNDKDKPGKPKGGDAQTLRAIFNYLVQKYDK